MNALAPTLAALCVVAQGCASEPEARGDARRYTEPRPAQSAEPQPAQKAEALESSEPPTDEAPASTEELASTEEPASTTEGPARSSLEFQPGAADAPWVFPIVPVQVVFPAFGGVVATPSGGTVGIPASPIGGVFGTQQVFVAVDVDGMTGVAGIPIAGGTSATQAGEIRPMTQAGEVPATQAGEVPATEAGAVPATWAGAVPATWAGAVPPTIAGEVPATFAGAVPATAAGEIPPSQGAGAVAPAPLIGPTFDWPGAGGISPSLAGAVSPSMGAGAVPPTIAGGFSGAQ